MSLGMCATAIHKFGRRGTVAQPEFQAILSISSPQERQRLEVKHRATRNFTHQLFHFGVIKVNKPTDQTRNVF
jgi:hypothetical protein